MSQISIVHSVSENVERVSLGESEYEYGSAIHADTYDVDNKTLDVLMNAAQGSYLYAIITTDPNGDECSLHPSLDEACADFDAIFADWTWDGETSLKAQIQPDIDAAIAAFRLDPSQTVGVSEPEGYSTAYLKRLLVSNDEPHVDDENALVIVSKTHLGVQYHPDRDAIFYVSERAGEGWQQHTVATYNPKAKVFTKIEEPLVREIFGSVERFKRAAAWYEFHC